MAARTAAVGSRAVGTAAATGAALAPASPSAYRRGPVPLRSARRLPRLGYSSGVPPSWTRFPACLAAGALLAASAVAGAEPSPKTTELVDHRCVGDLSEDELTLFANGTVRLRERVAERESMLLAELERREIDGFVARLLDIDLSEATSLRSGITGEWISQCGLALALPDRPRVFFRYGRFDVLPLSLESVRAVLGEVEALARTRARHGALPDGYQPHPGDFVRRTDGEVFEVIGMTSDGHGVELIGINQPITIYVALADFRAVFVAKEEGSLLDLER
jgi:hypothetical protein